MAKFDHIYQNIFYINYLDTEPSFHLEYFKRYLPQRFLSYRIYLTAAKQRRGRGLHCLNWRFDSFSNLDDRPDSLSVLEFDVMEEAVGGGSGGGGGGGLCIWWREEAWCVLYTTGRYNNIVTMYTRFCTDHLFMLLSLDWLDLHVIEAAVCGAIEIEWCTLQFCLVTAYIKVPKTMQLFYGN